MIGRRIPTAKLTPTKTHKSAQAQPAQSTSGNGAPPPTKSAPSVPISLYRELSADLQATQDNMTRLRSENLLLAEQNLQLRQELTQLAEQTRQVVHRFEQTSVGNNADTSLLLDELGFEPDAAADRSQMLNQLYRALPDYAPEDCLGEDCLGLDQPTGLRSAPWSGMSLANLSKLGRPKVKRPQFSTSQVQNPFMRQAASEGELSGWKLTLVMGLIIFSAFGAGFLIVRPLLAPNPSR